MKLHNDFYTIVSTSETQQGFSSKISLCKEHLIYSGHFPGFPVTPGVVQLQILHECLENYLGKKIQLRHILNCKFLQIIDPNKISEFQLEVHINHQEDKILRIFAQAINSTQALFKLDAEYFMG